MAEEEDTISCSVCSEIYNDPRSLPCGHSFCLQCISRVADNRKIFSCPICRDSVNLKAGKVETLPKNFGLCVVIEAKDKKQNSVCAKHKKLLDIFCNECDIPICSKCLFMEHKSHDSVDIDDIFLKRNKEVSSYLVSTRIWASKIEMKQDVVKQSRDHMQRNVESIQQSVVMTFKKWNGAIRVREKNILRCLDTKADTRRKYYDEAGRVLMDAMTKVTELENEIKNIQKQDKATFVQQYSSINARREDVEHTVLRDIDSCFEQPDDLQLEVYAPWMTEAVKFIKLNDKKEPTSCYQTPKISEIQEENAILKSELDYIHRGISQLISMSVGEERSEATLSPERTNSFTAVRHERISNAPKKTTETERRLKLDEDLKLVAMAWRDMNERNTAEVQRLVFWNDYLDSLVQNIHDRVVSGTESTPEALKQPAGMNLESPFAKRYQDSQDICERFMRLERDNKELKEKHLCLEIILAALHSYCTSTSQTKDISFDIPDQIKFDSRFACEFRQAQNITKGFEEMKTLKTLKANHEKLQTDNKRLEKSLQDANRELSACKKEIEKKPKEYNHLQTLEARHGKLQTDHKKLEKRLHDAFREKSILEDKTSKMNDYISYLKQEKADIGDQHQRMIEHKSQEITQLRQEKESLLTRLSEIADQLTIDNVNIAAVSVASRPTKLSEIYSELYDNEWTDAFEELTENMDLSDEDAISLLLKILMDAFRKCKEITWDRYEYLKLVASTLDVKQENIPSMITKEKKHIPKTRLSESEPLGTDSSDATTARLLKDKFQGLVTAPSRETTLEAVGTDISNPTTTDQPEDTTKDVVEDPSGENTSELCVQSASLTSTLSIGQEKSLKNIWRATSINLKDDSLKLLCANLIRCLGKPETEMPKTARYLSCCIDLCWKMGVQERLMHLDVNAEKEMNHEKQFDLDKFRPYTKTGKYVAYVVWPALFLHEGGALLTKGIAQGCQKQVSTKLPK